MPHRRHLSDSPVLPPPFRIRNRRVTDLDRAEFEKELADLVSGHVQNGVKQPLPQGVRSAEWSPSRSRGDCATGEIGPRGELRVLLADMSGSGLARKLASLPVLRAFHLEARGAPDCMALAGSLNRAVRRDLPPGFFARSVLIELELDRRHLRVLNCGLPVAWLLEAPGAPARGDWRRFPANHPPLGVMSEGEFSTSCYQAEWEEGQLLVACTDGIPGAEALEDARFGEAALRRSLLDRRHERDVAGAVLKDVLEFCWPRLPSDDLTIVVVE